MAIYPGFGAEKADREPRRRAITVAFQANDCGWISPADNWRLHQTESLFEQGYRRGRMW